MATKTRPAKRIDTSYTTLARLAGITADELHARHLQLSAGQQMPLGSAILALLAILPATDDENSETSYHPDRSRPSREAGDIWPEGVGEAAQQALRTLVDAVAPRQPPTHTRRGKVQTWPWLARAAETSRGPRYALMQAEVQLLDDVPYAIATDGRRLHSAAVPHESYPPGRYDLKGQPVVAADAEGRFPKVRQVMPGTAWPTAGAIAGWVPYDQVPRRTTLMGSLTELRAESDLRWCTTLELPTQCAGVADIVLDTNYLADAVHGLGTRPMVQPYLDGPNPAPVVLAGIVADQLRVALIMPRADSQGAGHVR